MAKPILVAGKKERKNSKQKGISVKKRKVSEA